VSRAGAYSEGIDGAAIAARAGRHTFALGPNATPRQVIRALVADRKLAATGPILCSVYRLAAWRNHWNFGVSPTDDPAVALDWCTAPRFTGVR